MEARHWGGATWMRARGGERKSGRSVPGGFEGYRRAPGASIAMNRRGCAAGCEPHVFAVGRELKFAAVPHDERAGPGDRGVENRVGGVFDGDSLRAGDGSVECYAAFIYDDGARPLMLRLTITGLTSLNVIERVLDDCLRGTAACQPRLAA